MRTVFFPDQERATGFVLDETMMPAGRNEENPAKVCADFEI